MSFLRGQKVLISREKHLIPWPQDYRCHRSFRDSHLDHTTLGLRKPEGVSVTSNRPLCPNSVWDTYGIVAFAQYCRLVHITEPAHLFYSLSLGDRRAAMFFSPNAWIPNWMDGVCHGEGLLNRGFSLLPSAGVTASRREGKIIEFRVSPPGFNSYHCHAVTS